jgi:glutathione S-transferase
MYKNYLSKPFSRVFSSSSAIIDSTMTTLQQQPKNAIYYNPGSIFSNVGLLLLHEKQVQDQFEFVPIQVGIDNIKPWYIKLNPRGQVPTLVHQGQPIPDTLDIAKFLDTTFSPAIFSLDDPKAIEIVEKWRQVRPISLLQGKKSPTQDVGQMENALKESRNQVLKYMQENPDLEQAYKTRLEIHDNRTKVLLDHDIHLLHKKKLQEVLSDIENTLKENKGQLLSDKSHSIADTYTAAILYWLHSKLGQDIVNDYPLITSYYKQQSAKTAFVKAFK